MRFDVDLHRHTLKLSSRLADGQPLQMSVVDAGPRDAAQTMVFIHGFGGHAAYWDISSNNFRPTIA
jgi:long-chain acyl-CoA synthetase